MKFNKQEHAVYYTRYHVVFSTRYRRKILRGSMGEYLKRCLQGITRLYPEIHIEEANTDEDHVHLLLNIPPKMAVSRVVNMLKSNTGRMMRKRFLFLSKLYVKSEGIWSTGYFVSTVGVNEALIRKYIEYQGDQDRGQAQLDL